MSADTVLRLRCPDCGADLANVGRNPYARPGHPTGQFAVIACRTGTVRAFTPGEQPKPGVAYCIGCRKCHRQHNRLAGLVTDYWRIVALPASRQVVTATIGADL
jgi:hypothetical protein